MKPARSLLLFALLGAILGHAAETTPPAGGPVEALPDMKVKGTVQCSFGFGVTMIRQAGTTKLRRLFLAQVPKDSAAAKAGLKTGDEILSINGKKVRGMDSTARQGGELFTLLCNRTPGDTIELEVVIDDQDRVQRLTFKAVKPSDRDR